MRLSVDRVSEPSDALLVLLGEAAPAPHPGVGFRAVGFVSRGGGARGRGTPRKWLTSRYGFPVCTKYRFRGKQGARVLFAPWELQRANRRSFGACVSLGDPAQNGATVLPMDTISKRVPPKESAHLNENATFQGEESALQANSSTRRWLLL